MSRSRTARKKSASTSIARSRRRPAHPARCLAKQALSFKPRQDYQQATDTVLPPRRVQVRPGWVTVSTSYLLKEESDGSEAVCGWIALCDEGAGVDRLVCATRHGRFGADHDG